METVIPRYDRVKIQSLLWESKIEVHQTQRRNLNVVSMFIIFKYDVASYSELISGMITNIIYAPATIAGCTKRPATIRQVNRTHKIGDQCYSLCTKDLHWSSEYVNLSNENRN